MSRLRTFLSLLAFIAATGFLEACGGGGSVSAPPPSLTLTLGQNTVTVTQDGLPSSVSCAVSSSKKNTASVAVGATNLPNNLTYSVTQPSTGTCSIAFQSGTGQTLVAAGNYTVTIQAASSGATGARANLAVTVAPVVKIESTTDISSGSNGSLDTFLSTSFGPMEWLENFFVQNPNATTTLSALNSAHINFQPLEKGTPQQADGTWDFSVLNAIVDPVVALGDKSPLLQLPIAPDWMNDSNGHLAPSHFQDFANYCAQIVRFYNTHAGFVDTNGVSHAHTPFTPVTWWGVFNEPNINGLSAAQYAELYNTVVPMMQAAGSEEPLKFVAVELSDWGMQPQDYLPTFVSGVTAQVDAVATHYYGATDQTTPDASLFANVSQIFAPHVQYFRSQLKSVPVLASVPVWVTENNVNSDVADANGNSMLNPGQKFVTDLRGTSVFFAAWRPYVFSQLVKAGANGIYHWEFASNPQYGEVNFQNGEPFLSYWVDYYLARYFPASGTALILNASNTETATVEALAIKNIDGSVVVMIVDHAIHSSADDNGAGDPRTVVVDLSSLGAFTSASELVIDANTNLPAGPAPLGLSPESRMTLTMGGYGVVFLSLN